MTTEEFNAPNARGEEQSAVTVRECQGTICTITAKIFKKNFDLNVTSRTDLTYGDLD
ncbi:hypothetical protein [Deinococcus sp. AJ005]|uniref:hypothetical protein n=1 Tax=Deinococcus sp. AJ005 TaxID=2652443 RepID=UPI0018657E5E|nr:hypothetical protein [Deinococcus sp. AJ005]